MYSVFLARVIATYRSLLSSSKAFMPPSSQALELGNTPSLKLTKNTVSNSNPFAACTVIKLTVFSLVSCVLSVNKAMSCK